MNNIPSYSKGRRFGVAFAGMIALLLAFPVLAQPATDPVRVLVKRLDLE